MSNIKPIDEVMWAVVDKDGVICYNTANLTNIDAIVQFVADSPLSWEYYKFLGYTCQQVRVRIEPIKQE
jgi:hypothetical protein